MKLKALSLFALAALFAGCSSDITDEQSANNQQESPEVINATIENARMDAQSRATFASDASFIWTSGDRIGVSQTNGSTTSFSTFKLSKGAGTAKATFIGSLSSGYTIGNKLVYPKSAVSSLSGTTLTISLPAEYEYAYETESFGTTTGDINSANMPMLANYTGSGVEFKHLGGYFVFEISKIPAGCNKFEFEAINNKKLSGTFTVDASASEPSYSTSTSASANKITINFPETTAESKRLFIVPVPVGSYEYEWNIYNTAGDIKGFGASDDAISVSRGQIKAMRLDCIYIDTRNKMINGHEYVDLGLTRADVYGTSDAYPTKKILFAKCNIGADCETDFGYYFRWGELNGWKVIGTVSEEMALSSSNCIQQPKVGTTDVYANGNMETYVAKTFWSNLSQSSNWSLDGQNTATDFQSKNDKDMLKCNAQIYGDAATYNWGNGWHMMNEKLVNAFSASVPGTVTIGSVTITKKWYSNYNNSGIAGIELSNGEAKLFLPASGLCGWGYRHANSYSYYWSSTSRYSGGNEALCLRSASNYSGLTTNKRSYGFCVRPVSE